MAEGQAAGNQITVTVKTPKNKESITIDENADIKDVSTSGKRVLVWGYVRVGANEQREE